MYTVFRFRDLYRLLIHFQIELKIDLLPDNALGDLYNNFLIQPQETVRPRSAHIRKSSLN